MTDKEMHKKLNVKFLSYLITILPFTGGTEILWFNIKKFLQENDNTFNVETIIFHKGTIKQFKK